MSDYNSEFDIKPNVNTPRDMMCKWNLTNSDSITDEFMIERSSLEEVVVLSVINGDEYIIDPQSRRTLQSADTITEYYSIDNADSVTIMYRAEDDITDPQFKLITDKDYSSSDCYDN